MSDFYLRETQLQMGMPITMEVRGSQVAQPQRHLDAVFAYFEAIDEAFSTYKATSEISRLNRGELAEDEYSDELREILALGEQTRCETDGYFDMRRGDGSLDPSGIVKGWAIRNAAELLRRAGFRDFYVEAGGDVEIAGTRDGSPWRVGIRNPFNRHENVKVLALSDCGVATSGTAIRGQHVYNPHRREEPLLDVVSVTVIAADVYEADRFATAAFAMGSEGIGFIERRSGLEGYMIDATARATFTSGFERYVLRV